MIISLPFTTGIMSTTGIRCIHCGSFISSIRVANSLAFRKRLPKFCSQKCINGYQSSIRRERRFKDGLCAYCGSLLDTKSKRRCRKCLNDNRDCQRRCRGVRTSKGPRRRGSNRCIECYGTGHMSAYCPMLIN